MNKNIFWLKFESRNRIKFCYIHFVVRRHACEECNEVYAMNLAIDGMLQEEIHVKPQKFK